MFTLLYNPFYNLKKQKQCVCSVCAQRTRTSRQLCARFTTALYIDIKVVCSTCSTLLNDPFLH